MSLLLARQTPATTPAVSPTSYPDSIARTQFHASQQQSVAQIPQSQTPVIFDWMPSYPDYIHRSRSITYLSQSIFFEPQPERTVPLAAVSFPDAVARPSFGVTQQQAVTEVSPKPERTSPLATALYPDSVTRPVLHASQQQAVTEISPQPERTSPLATALYPDTVVRPSMHVSQQQALTEISPKPERTTPLTSVTFPDAVTRPAMHASQQQALTEISPQPERTLPIATVVQPDILFRMSFHASQQQASTTYPFPTPAAVTTTFFQSIYPDWIDRRTAQKQQAFASTVQPERTSSLAATIYPDRVDRPFFAASSQQFLAFAPQPERTSPLASAWYPDRIYRPSLDAWQQQSTTTISPKPEEKIQLDWQPTYPDRPGRIQLLTADQQFLVLATQPERTAPLASVVYQDRVYRPSFDAYQQQALTTISPKPEEKIQLDWQPIYTDRAFRIHFHASNQQALAFNSQPERTLPLTSSIYPDRIYDRRFITVLQQSVTTLYPQPEEKIQLDWLPSFPDRASRQTIAVTTHQTLALAPQPETVLLIGTAFYPAWMDRPNRVALDQYTFPPFVEPTPPLPPPPPPPPPPAPIVPSPPSFPNGPGAAAGGGGGWGYVPSMWSPQNVNDNDNAYEIVEENDDGEWSVKSFSGLPEINKQPNIFLKQYIYNFASDVPEETRGRVVTLLQEFEGEDLFVRMANSFGSYDRALVAFQNQEMAKRRQVVVDISFDSAEELDRLTTIALSNGFFVESAEGKKISLLAPAVEPKKIDFGLLDSLKVWLSQKQAQPIVQPSVVQPTIVTVIAPQLHVVINDKSIQSVDVDAEEDFGAIEVVDEPAHTKLVKQRKPNVIGLFAIGVVVGWLLSSAVKSLPKSESKPSKRKR